MTANCTWATCNKTAAVTVDGWPFCDKHADEHDEMRMDGSLPGRSPHHDGPVRRSIWRPNSYLTRQQLLDALLEEVAQPVMPYRQRRPLTPAARRADTWPWPVAS